MDQDLCPPNQNPLAPAQKPTPAVTRAPYVKPEVHSDFAPLLALLTSACDLDVTPLTGGGG